jgi:hypothetical protein
VDGGVLDGARIAPGVEAGTVEVMLVGGNAVRPITKPEPGDTSTGGSGPVRDAGTGDRDAGTGAPGRCDSYTRIG